MSAVHPARSGRLRTGFPAPTLVVLTFGPGGRPSLGPAPSPWYNPCPPPGSRLPCGKEDSPHPSRKSTSRNCAAILRC